MAKRLNITIPDEIARELDKIPNKSKFIAQAVADRIEEIRRENLIKKLKEGYRATRKEDKIINEEWEQATLEGLEK